MVVQVALRVDEAAQLDDVPRRGHGMAAAGGALMIGGTLTTIVGAVVWSADSGFDGPPPGGVAAVTTGLSAFATGYRPQLSPAIAGGIVSIRRPDLRS
jgi:hypothetical protein